MAVATEPEPARLPLAGGRSGATVRVHALRTGEILLPPRAFDRPSGAFAKTRGKGLHIPRSRWQWAPVPAFLVEHPGAGPILVDSGLHASVAIDPRISLGRRQPRRLPVRLSAERTLPAQLRDRGIDALQIAVVVMTHLHHDHASGIAQFSNATFVVTSLEWRIACAGGDKQGYRHAHFDHPLDCAPSTTQRVGPAVMAASTAPSTSSATARCGCCSRPATRAGTSRSSCAWWAATCC